MDLEDHGLTQLLVICDEIEELRINKDQHAPALDSVSSDDEVGRREQLQKRYLGWLDSDVTVFLRHRELKLHGGVITDSRSDMRYISVCMQIYEGLSQK